MITMRVDMEVKNNMTSKIMGILRIHISKISKTAMETIKMIILSKVKATKMVEEGEDMEGRIIISRNHHSLHLKTIGRVLEVTITVKLQVVIG